MTNQYRGIVFDLHFTLIHFNPGRGILYQKICHKYGIEVSPKKIDVAFASGWRDYSNKELAAELSKHTTERKMEAWWLKFHQKLFQRLEVTDAGAIKKIHQEISRHVYNNPKIHKLYPDTLRILPFLKEQGIKLGLITNAHTSMMQVIKIMGLDQYFDYIAISCVLGISKPDPKIFTLTAKKLGLPPKDILFVGDSYHTDVIGAYKAGCGTAIIDRRNNPLKKQYDCAYLNNLVQLKNLVRY